MANKKGKNAKRKQKRRKENLSEKNKALMFRSSKLRWVCWMRKLTYEGEFKEAFTKEVLSKVQATLKVREIILKNAGTDPFVRMELSGPNEHVNALRNFVRSYVFNLHHYGKGRFVDLGAKQYCKASCKFSSENLFLVGFLTEKEHKVFGVINTEDSVLRCTAEIIEYTFSRERRTLVEIYADVDCSMQRELLLGGLADLNFQEAIPFWDNLSID